MSVLVKKVCLLGNFAVGKTSLCRRFVNNSFSHDYQTTLGVNIQTKTLIATDDNKLGNDTKLIIWDIAGELASPALLENYLRGCQGCVLVADGTRLETLDSVVQLHQQLQRNNPDIATSCMINKADLKAQWETPPEWVAARREQGWDVQRSSALNGEGVEAGFIALAQRLLS